MSKPINVRLLPTELQHVNEIKKRCNDFQEKLITNAKNDVTKMTVNIGTDIDEYSFNKGVLEGGHKTKITIDLFVKQINGKTTPTFDKVLQICLMQSIFNVIEKESQTKERNFKKLLEETIPAMTIVLSPESGPPLTLTLTRKVEIEEIVISCEIKPVQVEIDEIVISCEIINDIPPPPPGQTVQTAVLVDLSDGFTEKKKNSRRGRLNH